MRLVLDLDGLREAKGSEYLLRFAFGGTVTAISGVIAQVWGPLVGGLFLAFPAILPASLTLVARHEGRAKAASQARGAVVGAVGLAVFAGTNVLLAEHAPATLTLVAATGAWLGTSFLLWWVFWGAGR